MKHLANWILYLGDLLALEGYAFFVVARFYDTDHQILYLLLACGPIFLSWTVVGVLLKAFDANQPLQTLLLRAGLAWPLVFAFHEAVYALAFNPLMRGVAAAQFRIGWGTAVLLLGGFLLLAAWRSVFYLLYQGVRSPRRAWRWLTRGVLAGMLGLLVILCLPRVAAGIRYAPQIYSLENAPARPVALVFGAGLFVNNTPSFILKDRVVTAAALYRAGKVERLILSGDASDPTGDEVEAMRKLALANGVPESALLLDAAGYRTYDSCARAVQAFHATRAILVSQVFYLDRALYLCNHLGLESIGVTSDLSPHSLPSLALWKLREIPASFLAWWEISIAPDAGQTLFGQD